MAKEHIYTRANEGFFTHCEGYDTIALSNGLDEEYVKQNIYPFCFYEKHNFEDIMPDVYYYKYIKNPQNNNVALIFGKNSYVCSSRNYILCNSLIICDEEELKLLDINFENFIEFSDFKQVDSPCIIKDKNIEEYFKPYNVLIERAFIFRLFNISEQNYKELLYAIFRCIEQKETLYIKLDCDRKFYSRYAKKLLKLIFINIPSTLKRNLSYITYSPTIKTNIFFHIVFLDKEVDTKNIKDMGYYFDFSNDKFNQKSYFLDFAWKNIIFANKMFLSGSLYQHEYSSSNILTQLNKATLKELENCKYKFEPSEVSHTEYIKLINLFFDLRTIEKVNYINNIKVLAKKQQKQLKNYSQNDILDIVDFLLTKKLDNNKDNFIKVVNYSYGLDFNETIKFIINKINNLNNFEDFIIISFFYINYINDLLNEEVWGELFNSIIQKLFCFETHQNIRKENINDLSIYLWKRYRDWI